MNFADELPEDTDQLAFWRGLRFAVPISLVLWVAGYLVWRSL